MSNTILMIWAQRPDVRAAVLAVSGLMALAFGPTLQAQVVEGQAVDENGAPLYRVDPFWPKSLPNNWSMQQVTGIGVDDQDIVWFLNRPNAPDPLEIIAESVPERLRETAYAIACDAVPRPVQGSAMSLRASTPLAERAAGP